jgi:amino acid efflux transporter
MSLTTTRGIALYIGALLGPGLLVLPGLAAALAGPASILAWLGLLILSGLVAVVFARLGVDQPSGGVTAYARAGLGEWAGRAAGWCFLAGIIAGAPAVCYLGAAYLADLLGGGRVMTAGLGAALLLAVLLISRRGVAASTTVQLGLVAVLLVVVVLAVAGALPAARREHWLPFAPHGWDAIGAAAAVLMLSFVGWEAIAPLVGHFRDVRRQLPRVIGAAFAVTAVVYLALAAVTVAALGPAAGTEVPLADLLALGWGRAGPAVAAVAALMLTLGTVNAYVTGGAGLARSLTRGPGGRVLPRWFVTAMVAAGVAALGLLGTGVVPLARALAVTSAFFLVVYLGCMVAAVRLLTGPLRVAAASAGLLIVVVLAFTGWAVLPAVVVALASAGRPVRGRMAAKPVTSGSGARSPGG